MQNVINIKLNCIPCIYKQKLEQDNDKHNGVCGGELYPPPIFKMVCINPREYPFFFLINFWRQLETKRYKSNI